jgi:uncharacterized paraquat-inducible protein A
LSEQADVAILEEKIREADRTAIVFLVIFFVTTLLALAALLAVGIERGLDSIILSVATACSALFNAVRYENRSSKFTEQLKTIPSPHEDRTCPECGRKLPQESNTYCPYCGASIGNE